MIYARIPDTLKFLLPMSPEKTEEKQHILSEFDKLLSERYLSYSLSTIISRSLPDVRDGLKPVHRRILFAMYELKLGHNSGFKKCARIIGDVIGKYHPHGDVAVYDSLVRLAQSFSLRYPLIEGQGNFGSVDGDNPAAMRYTESRLTLIANYMLDELNQETVNFKPTYDGQEREPEILPAAFPNLLANGTEGIAVGMATNIPSHNLEELCDALVEIIKNPEISVRELVKIIPAPDFPTGGNLIFDQENMVNIYETGRGSVTVRSNWYKEELPHNSYQIVIDELPYQSQKSRIIVKLAELFKEKKLPLLGNIIDESSEHIRLVLVPKNRSIDAEVLMEHVFKYTDLETNFNFNMNVITKDSLPKLMSLKEILVNFLEYRREVVTNRSNFRLSQINNRIELLEGYLIVYLNLDKVIEIIRYEDNPKEDLISNFNLSDTQAESILNMRLRSLRKLEEIAINKELTSLKKEKSELQGMISDPKKLSQIIVKEINAIKKAYGKSTDIGQRKTKLISKTALKNLPPIENYSEKELMTIVCSKINWIRSIKNHNLNREEIRYKEGDAEKFIIEASNHDKLLVFTELGKFYTIDCEKISRNKNTGEPIKTMIDIDDKDQILNIFIYKPQDKYLLASKSGKAFIVESENLLAQTKLGKNILTVSEEDPAYICRVIKGNKIAVIGENRKMLIFDVSEVPIMKKGQGVKLQKYQNSNISDLKSFAAEEGLTWQKNGKIITQKDLTSWTNYRATSGKLPPANFPASGLFEIY